MKKLLVEFIGTFFLVLVVGLTLVEPGAGSLAPIAIGATIAIMVYAGGYISGGHYNPAVTLAVWIRGKCDTKEVLPYFGVQVAGALVAAVVVNFLKAGAFIAPANPEISKALLVEVLFTFALAYVVLQTATSPQTSGNSYYGLAIGSTVLVGAFAGGAISGGVYNPAVAVGAIVMGLMPAGNIWIFLVANFAGGALAGLVFKMVNPAQS